MYPAASTVLSLQRKDIEDEGAQSELRTSDSTQIFELHSIVDCFGSEHYSIFILIFQLLYVRMNHYILRRL